jgi:glycerol-3-phosphate acyltransferase PlsY
LTVRLVLFVVAYLLGSIPTAFLLVRLIGRGDVRAIGSGNVGATNALRAAGWRAALAVLAIDVAKGALAVALMRQAADAPAWAAAAGFAAVAGHCFPVWLSFSGGKGVATAVGAFAMIAPAAVPAAAAVWLVVFVAARYVALASVLAALALPVAAQWLVHPPRAVLGWCAATVAVVIWRHRANLARLAHGAEPKLGAKGAL